MSSLPQSIPQFEIKDITLAPSGQFKIDWAYKNMPVLRAIEKELIEEQPFKGLKIAISVHVEAKTACLARALSRGGAEVALTGCNPLSTQDDVAAALASCGMHVYTIHGDSEDNYIRHLKMALAFEPDIVIDDGGDFAMLLHSDLKNLTVKLLGGCEETTTGVRRLEILEKEGTLSYPVVAVNDARCKHLFDNRFGTGQSVWTAIMATTNLIVTGKTVVIAGFGNGNINSKFKEKLKNAVKTGTVIVMSSRVASGEIVAGQAAKETGIICAGNLNPQKARILLILALATNKNLNEIQEIFATH